ncbi:MAG: cytochrome C [Gammaproteobacteria bacterium SG8_11]|nr:MAG: cytochrome C [Gammaproteobacteria bacterium SG8_11]
MKCLKGLFFSGLVMLFTPAVLWASSSGMKLDHANIDLNDVESLRRGAKYFADYCFNCHSIQFMRYSRIAKDLEIPEDEVAATMLFTGAKIGDAMNIALDQEDAKRWFGVAPPDLSVVSRSRGVDWIYTYLRSFYKDESRPWGVNNAVFKDVAMPHVLWELQGLQEATTGTIKSSEGVESSVITGFTLVEKGKLSSEEFDNTVRDIVNFLAYVGEPTKTQRLSLGRWVLAFLVLYFVVMFLLKKEYWKDVK